MAVRSGGERGGGLQVRKLNRTTTRLVGGLPSHNHQWWKGALGNEWFHVGFNFQIHLNMPRLENWWVSLVRANFLRGSECKKNYPFWLVYWKCDICAINEYSLHFVCLFVTCLSSSHILRTIIKYGEHGNLIHVSSYAIPDPVFDLILLCIRSFETCDSSLLFFSIASIFHGASWSVGSY
jgi:hypothetical protein